MKNMQNSGCYAHSKGLSGDISSTVRPYLASQKPAIQRRQANKNTRFLVYTLKTVFLNIFTLAVFSDLKCMKG